KVGTALGSGVPGAAGASHQLAPAVGADLRHGRRAVRAESALERASVGLGVRRQGAAALLAAVAHLEGHGSGQSESRSLAGKIVPLRDARRSFRRGAVVQHGAFVVTGHLEQMRADGMEAVLAVLLS